MADKEHIDDLKERFQRYETHYEGLYSEMREAEKYFRGKFEITKPKEVAAVIPPTARNKVETAVTEMLTDKPKVRRRRSDEDSEAQKKRNDQIEAGYQALLLDAEEYLQTPLLHEMGNLQMRRGSAVLYGPLYKLREHRIYYDALDPLSVYFEPGAWPREAFLHLSMTVAEMGQLAERYPLLSGFDPGNRHETEEITLVQWTKAPPPPAEGELPIAGRYAAWVKDDKGFLAKPQSSGYPYLPFDPVYTGWGLRVLGAKAEDVAVSLIHPGTRPLLVNEAEMYTILTAAAGYETWGRYYTEEGQVLPDGFKVEYAPGSITSGVPAGGLKPFTSQPLSPAVPEHFARIYQLLQEAFFSAILAGQAQPGQRTATANAILSGNTRKKFFLPMRMLQGGVSRMLARTGVLMEFLSKAKGSEQLFVWRGNKISHTMFGGDYSVEVDLIAPDVQEERIKVAEGKTLVGILDERTILEEYLMQENASKVMRDKLFDRLVNSEAFLQGVLEAYQGQLQGSMRPVTVGANGNGNGQQPGATMERLSQMYRAAKTGFQPEAAGGLGTAVAGLREARTL